MLKHLCALRSRRVRIEIQSIQPLPPTRVKYTSFAKTFHFWGFFRTCRYAQINKQDDMDCVRGYRWFRQLLWDALSPLQENAYFDIRGQNFSLSMLFQDQPLGSNWSARWYLSRQGATLIFAVTLVCAATTPLKSWFGTNWKCLFRTILWNPALSFG